jgi:hypothetical protein
MNPLCNTQILGIIDKRFNGLPTINIQRYNKYNKYGAANDRSVYIHGIRNNARLKQAAAKLRYRGDYTSSEIQLSARAQNKYNEKGAKKYTPLRPCINCIQLCVLCIVFNFAPSALKCI